MRSERVASGSVFRVRWDLHKSPICSAQVADFIHDQKIRFAARCFPRAGLEDGQTANKTDVAMRHPYQVEETSG